jgi:hypothetical protein
VAWAACKNALAAVLAALAVPSCADIELVYRQDFEYSRHRGEEVEGPPDPSKPEKKGGRAHPQNPSGDDVKISP